MLPEYPSWLQPGMLSVPHGRWRSLLTIRIHGAPMTSILKVKPPNQGLFQPKKESFGFHVYINLDLPDLENFQGLRLNPRFVPQNQGFRKKPRFFQKPGFSKNPFPGKVNEMFFFNSIQQS